MSLNERKVFSCKRCQKKLRVPIKSGKKLLVDCPSCGQENQISFQGVVWLLTASKRNCLLMIMVGLILFFSLLALTLGQRHSQGLKKLEKTDQRQLENEPVRII